MAADAPEVVEIEELLERPRSEPPSGSPTRRAVVAGLALLIALGGFALAASAFLGEPPVEGKDPPAPVLGNGRIAIAQGPDQDVVLIDPDGSDPTTLVDRHGASLPYGLDLAWSPDGSMLAYTDVRDDGLDGLFVLDLATGEVLDLSEGLADAAKPAWSPDGTRIAFTGLDRATGYDIYVVGSDGTGRVPITAEADNGVDGAHMPAWSPDGSRIAFAVDRYDEATETEDHGIVVVDASGGNEFRLTNSLDEQPVWSPDGSRLAFVRKATDAIELYVVNADGSGERRISGEGISTSLPSWSPEESRLLFGTRDLQTSNLGIVVVDVENGDSRSLLEDAYVASPVWSPDGSWIAFVRDDAGRPLPRVSLWMMRPDGTDLVELADGLDGVSDIAWQPLPGEGSDPSPRPGTPAASNGSIYFAVGDDDWPTRIEAVEPDGSGRRVVVEGEPLQVTQLAWSPDGMRIAYRNPIPEEQGIYVANPDGTEPIRLTDGANDGWPTWSPDGTKIAFSSTRYDSSVGACTSSGDQDLGCPTDIYVMDADGSNVTRLTTTSGSEYQPVWSPDGTRIAFTHTLETWVPTAVYVMDADGTDARQVSTHDGGSDFAPTWSPDGSQLVFASIRYEDWGIFVVNADGSGEHEIEFEGEFGGWSENGPVWSPDGTFIASVCRPAAEGDDVVALCLVRPDGTDLSSIAEVLHGAGDIAWQPVVAEPPAPSPSQTATTSPEPLPPVDPKVTAVIPVGPQGNTTSLLYAGGSVWVTAYFVDGASMLIRIDASTDEIVAEIPLEGVPNFVSGGGGLAYGFGSVWVAGERQFDGASQAIAQRVDPGSNRVVASIPLEGTWTADVEVDESGVWAAYFGEEHAGVALIDPGTDSVIADVALPSDYVRRITAAGGGVVATELEWSGNEGPCTVLTAIDPATMTISAREPVGGPGCGGARLFAWNGEIWASAGGGLQRVDPITAQLFGEPIPFEPHRFPRSFLLATERELWFGAYPGGDGNRPDRLARLDPATGTIEYFTEAGGTDAVLDADGHTIWTLGFDGTLTRIDLR